MSIRPPHKGAHKLQRFKQASGRLIWKCILPDCGTFFTRELLLGRACICHRCGSEFVLDRKAINKGRTVKPHCRGCTKAKHDSVVEAALLPEESPI